MYASRRDRENEATDADKRVHVDVERIFSPSAAQSVTVSSSQVSETPPGARVDGDTPSCSRLTEECHWPAGRLGEKGQNAQLSFPGTNAAVAVAGRSYLSSAPIRFHAQKSEEAKRSTAALP